MISLKEVVENLREELREFHLSRDTLINGMDGQADIKADLFEIKKKLIIIQKSTSIYASKNIIAPLQSNTTDCIIPKPLFSEAVKMNSNQTVLKKGVTTTVIKRTADSQQKIQRVCSSELESHVMGRV